MQERGPRGGEGSVRVVTWNIEHGRDSEAAAEVIQNSEHLRGADLLLLQEMDEVGTSSIAAVLGWEFVYAAASVHTKTGREFGNAIVSRWPLADRRVVLLPHRSRVSGEPRNALAATIDVAGTPLAAYCTHTEIPMLGRSKRRQQTDTVGTAALAGGVDHVVVGGDFNTASKRSTSDLVAGFADRGFTHASASAVNTLRRAGRDFTLDHVFAKGLTAVGAGVVREVAVSDHDPVWVALQPE